VNITGSNLSLTDLQSRLVVCPNCGQYTIHQEISFQRGSRGNKVRLATWIAPFIKTPPTKGHVCEHCRNMFNITRGSMPWIYYAWILLLLSIASGVAILLYLLLFGP